MSKMLESRLRIPQFETFGTAIDAAGLIGFVPQLMDALEAGEIRAEARSKPRATEHVGNKTLKDAASPTPSWWRDYRTICEGNTVVPLSWIQWLRSKIEVDHGKVLSLFQDIFGKSQEKYRVHLDQSGDKPVWSHREALAWLASGDDHLVHSVRDFALSSSNRRSEIEARKQGLQYLRLQIAWHHCRCGSVRPLLAFKSPGSCRCSQAAWQRFIQVLDTGAIEVQFHCDQGISKTMSPLDLSLAEPDFDAGKVRLGGTPGELKFFKSAFLSTAQFQKLGPNHDGTEHPAEAAPSPKAKARVGRPKGSGMKDEAHLQEMYKLLTSREATSLRDAAKMVEPSANSSKNADPESVIRRLIRKYKAWTETYLN